MPLMPKRVKFKAQQRMSRAGNATRNNKLDFGEFGLQTLERGWITSAQIESCRVAVTRHMKRKGKVWLRIFPDKPITKKPLETRMGKGKGPTSAWVAVVKPGNIIMEIEGVPEEVAKEALRLGAHKMGLRMRYLSRKHHGRVDS